MTTLGAPAGLADTTLQLDSIYTSSGDYPIPITVESEAMAIVGGKGSSVVSVARGLNGTTQTAHPIGSTVSPGSGGAAQTVSLLGPFPISHSTPGIYGGSPTVFLADLPPGTVIVRSWCVFSATFTPGTNAFIRLCIAKAGDLDNVAPFAYFTAATEGPEGGGYVGQFPITSAEVVERAAMAAGVGDKLSVYEGSDDDPPTTGACDVYALIATPA